MGPKTSVGSWYFKQRLGRIKHFIENPDSVQKEQLRTLLSGAKKTAFGLKYSFESIKSPKDYSERVPLQDYETLKVFIDRMRLGESNLLWPGKVRWFAKSSGTTSNKSKYIPITSQVLHECHYKGARDVLACYFSNTQNSQLFEGKTLIMGGSMTTMNEKTFIGDLSSILLLNSPIVGKWFSAINTSISLIKDWEEKLDAVAKKTINQNITSFGGVPSWNLLLLKRILEVSGKESILDVWPNLELFIHGGVSFIPYREQFQKIIPSAKMRYLETFNASEGFFGIQNDFSNNDMLLMLDYGIYYEFLPLAEINNPAPQTLTLEQVQVGKHYAMIITTNGGLWRYSIGDTVEFTSTLPYKFKIVGRTASYINAFGEELMVFNTDKAFEYACQQTGAVITEYTGGPVFLDGNRAAAHEYIVEFEKPPPNIKVFATIFDSKIMELNSDYEAKRSKDMLLKMPVINSAPKNTFYKWMKARGKVGGQNKIPRLSNNRLILDELLSFMNN